MRADVVFPGNGMSLAGHLYTPDVPDGVSGPLPAIVIAHPWGGVKEQTAGLYARRLAGLGFAALAFDAAFQGESGGEPRFLEDPFQRAEDVSNAVSYLTTRQDVDPDGIGALGICTGGGHITYAAASDHRINAVATVSAVDIGSLLRDGLGRTRDPAAFRDVVAQAGRLRTEEALGASARLEHILPEEVDESTPVHVREGHDYYRTPRGGHPRSENAWVLRSVDRIAQYDSFARIDDLAPRPLLMIAGSEAATAYFSREAVERAAGPKELFRVEGASHFDLYDKDEFVTAAVAKLTRFYTSHLRRSRAVQPTA
ncbi:alpha/beta hydrolase [Streptomyces griseorubiginosus]|uniref:alpha/beta hydrolase n=1 Tax=Streptomyces griseorubiginosus TaxID=67304 RepID=UPI0033D10023